MCLLCCLDHSSVLVLATQMQRAYDEYNERMRASGKSRGHFMVRYRRFLAT